MIPNAEKRTLLTVITEAVIEQSLLRDLESLGVRGYTVSDARGRGSRGVRDAAWDEVANIRIEVICQRTQAELLLAHIQDQYYADYAMIAFLVEIEILRGEKF
ncbi:MAG: transcriptional regulator [Azonexus sp.]|nr:transcriptional regulator [Azonexus sp.]MDZ4317070.1 transcriptional regulator [Azonexus sp.]